METSNLPKELSPYNDAATNLIYNLLFCDNLDLYKTNTQPPYVYPFDILFSGAATIESLQSIIDDKSAEPRVKVLAYNRQMAVGHTAEQKELLVVIIEVALDSGLDVLASFSDGTARYINQSGKILIWENSDDATSNEITQTLFSKSRRIIEQIGPWDEPRRPFPTLGNVRITFLVSDGLYFGEAPTDVLFHDPMASPALDAATQLLQYITEKQYN